MYIDIGVAENIFNNNNYETFKYLRDNKFEPISCEKFSSLIDLEEFAENEGWYPKDVKLQDPDVVFFKGIINDKEFVGIYHSGVNQIFSKNGIKISNEDILNIEIKNSAENDSLSWLLLPINSVSVIPKNGKEVKELNKENYNIIFGEKGIRYQLIEENKVISAAQIINNTIENIYTVREKRKQGYSKKLIEIIKKDFPNVQHSDNQTELGVLYSKNTGLKKKKIKFKN